MSRQYFGTDGVRGVANGSLLTPEFVLALGQAAASVIPCTENGFILIGRDSRLSGPMLEAALIAGITSIGRKPVSVGVVPTPAVSYITANSKADFGIMISASHNPVPDNGIKIFNSTGHKLDDETELKIEEELAKILADSSYLVRKTGLEIPQPEQNDQLINLYLNHLNKSVGENLNGLHIICDTAFGAAAPWAEQVFSRTGCQVKAINNKADGSRINVDCGSTNTKSLVSEVLNKKADLGLAFDGDADRLIAIDDLGNKIDGDHILYILATHLQSHNQLSQSAVVGTIMSNMGLELSLKEKGIDLIRAKVGDRYVWEQMQARNIILGGEQSGHIINSELSITGDGMLNGLLLASIVKQTGLKLSSLVNEMQVFPQCLINVEVADKKSVMENDLLLKTKSSVEDELKDRGRIVLRPSGTQQLVRVMVEAQSQELAENTAKKIAKVVKEVS